MKTFALAFMLALTAIGGAVAVRAVRFSAGPGRRNLLISAKRLFRRSDPKIEALDQTRSEVIGPHHVARGGSGLRQEFDRRLDLARARRINPLAQLGDNALQRRSQEGIANDHREFVGDPGDALGQLRA
jgi:hypothetical protein